jgi:diphthine synthase
MVLFLVGLGLGDPQDITVKGLAAVRSCRRLYLEVYTSKLVADDRAALEQLYGQPLIDADREFVESGCEEMLELALTENVALLVVGDPFGATTHSDLFLRAVHKGIAVEVVHNASIMNAIGVTGLQLYRFGETISLPFFTEEWRPYSFYEKLKENRRLGLHTLALLDIKVHEPNLEMMIRGKIQYDPPRFMTADIACSQLQETEAHFRAEVVPQDLQCVAVLRIGSSTQQILVGTLDELQQMDLGPPLHSLIIPGQLHEVEAEMLEHYRSLSRKA